MVLPYLCTWKYQISRSRLFRVVSGQAFYVSKDEDPHNLSGQQVPMFDHIHNKKQNFLVFGLNIPSSSLSLALSMHITQNSLTPHTIPSCICAHGWDPPEPSLLQTEQLFQPLCVCQMFQPLHCTLLDSLQYVCILLSWTLTPGVSPGLSRAEGSFTHLNLLAMLFLVQPRRLLKLERCFEIS